MGTQAYIANIQRDGAGRRIHLQMDGYPTWAGARLLLHYSNAQEINKLMDLGDLMTLGNNPGPDPGAFIHASSNTDRLGHITRAMIRDGQALAPGRLERYRAQHCEGGLAGIAPNPQFRPYTYAWTPDGWLGAGPDYRQEQQQFMPLLHLIHDYHRQNYEHCRPGGEPWSPYQLNCAVHGHTISLLQECLPRALLPTDPDHPNNLLQPHLPPEVRLALDERKNCKTRKGRE